MQEDSGLPRAIFHETHKRWPALHLHLLDQTSLKLGNTRQKWGYKFIYGSKWSMGSTEPVFTKLTRTSYIFTHLLHGISSEQEK